ncbi:hypothetical protein PLANPX_2632 [Lacipirellula parvula]|uniref:Uncharacterized protein n=1 Tax=Lacipirellula parvula TaxID=2650471 RepID=A0A5K7X8P5_9BACT|nr:hypothetical protein PLANPX_2632 [Lacipirellula parvula]
MKRDSLLPADYPTLMSPKIEKCDTTRHHATQSLRRFTTRQLEWLPPFTNRRIAESQRKRPFLSPKMR